jgi:serine/threonine-protein kinase
MISGQGTDTAADASTVVDGRYVLRREIAIGGGARVYAAEHRFLKRSVAVKLPRIDVQHAGQMHARLRREAEALGMIRHPAVVEVYDAGQVGSSPYIVMELLEGRTLAGLLASRGKLGVQEVIKIGAGVASALEACHAVGILHRDVKPSNLFVTLNPATPIKLLDFGIAKLLGEASAPHEKLTQDESILGTPEYMAPESLLASPNPDVRVDIYGLAVTLYECLTGAVPFDGRFGEVLLKLSTTLPPSLAEKRPDVPAAMAQVITKALSRDPQERYATMVDFREALVGSASSHGDVNLLQHGFGGAARPVAQAAAEPVKATVADSPVALRSVSPATRRKFPRAPYVTPARLVRANNESIDGRVEEVSEGGLLFVGSGKCEQGETVRIRFALPATGRIANVTAITRWVRAARGATALGFEFVDPGPDVKIGIKQYVEIMCPPT